MIRKPYNPESFWDNVGVTFVPFLVYAYDFILFRKFWWRGRSGGNLLSQIIVEMERTNVQN